MSPLSDTVVDAGLICFTLKSLPISESSSSLQEMKFQVQVAGTHIFRPWPSLVTQKVYSLFLFTTKSRTVLSEEESSKIQLQESGRFLSVSLGCPEVVRLALS